RRRGGGRGERWCARPGSSKLLALWSVTRRNRQEKVTFRNPDVKRPSNNARPAIPGITGPRKGAAMTTTTGLTKGGGWEIGVRRTVSADADDVWGLLRSPQGTAIWLGGPVEIAPGPYALDDGTDGEIRVDEHGSHIRLTWRPPGRDEPTLIQVRVLEA